MLVFVEDLDPVRIGYLGDSDLGCLSHVLRRGSPEACQGRPSRRRPIARRDARAGMADSPALPTHGERGDSGSALGRALLLGYRLAPLFEHLHEFRVTQTALGGSFGGGIPARHEMFDGLARSTEPPQNGCPRIADTSCPRNYGTSDHRLHHRLHQGRSSSEAYALVGFEEAPATAT